jgi:predicted Zn-dependent protease
MLRGRGASAKARDLSDRYTRASERLESGAFATAIPLLDQLQRDEPNYRDVPALLVRAREGLRQGSQAGTDTGTKLEAAGDLAGARSSSMNADARSIHRWLRWLIRRSTVSEDA